MFVGVLGWEGGQQLVLVVEEGMLLGTPEVFLEFALDLLDGGLAKRET